MYCDLCISLSRKPMLCLMKRLAFILIALFSLNIINVFAQESQDSQESSSVRISSTAVSSYTGEKPKSNMVLREMIKAPMGNVACSHDKLKYREVKKAAKSLYKVDDDSDSDSNIFYIFESDNPITSSLIYHGFHFFHYSFAVCKQYIYYERKIEYEFTLEYNLAKAYAYIEYILQDFKELGIPLAYKKENKDITKAYGKYIDGQIQYLIMLAEIKDYKGRKNLNLSISITYK